MKLYILLLIFFYHVSESWGLAARLPMYEGIAGREPHPKTKPRVAHRPYHRTEPLANTHLRPVMQPLADTALTEHSNVSLFPPIHAKQRGFAGFLQAPFSLCRTEDGTTCQNRQAARANADARLRLCLRPGRPKPESKKGVRLPVIPLYRGPLQSVPYFQKRFLIAEDTCTTQRRS